MAHEKKRRGDTQNTYDDNRSVVRCIRNASPYHHITPPFPPTSTNHYPCIDPLPPPPPPPLPLPSPPSLSSLSVSLYSSSRIARNSPPISSITSVHSGFTILFCGGEVDGWVRPHTHHLIHTTNQRMTITTNNQPTNQQPQASHQDSQERAQAALTWAPPARGSEAARPWTRWRAATPAQRLICVACIVLRC